MADIFQEVEEDVRRERLQSLWKKYGLFIVGGVLAVVILAAGIAGWRYYVTSERLAASDALSAALNLAAAGDRDGAVRALAELGENGRAPYGTLARLREAGLKADAGDRAGAIALYEDVARTAEDPAIAELAQLQAAIDSIEAETPDAVIARLQPLAAAGKPWQGIAREYIAFLTFKKGDVARARELWTEMSKDAALSPGQRSRADSMLAATAAGAAANGATQGGATPGGSVPGESAPAGKGTN